MFGKCVHEVSWIYVYIYDDCLMVCKSQIWFKRNKKANAYFLILYHIETVLDHVIA